MVSGPSYFIHVIMVGPDFFNNISMHKFRIQLICALVRVRARAEALNPAQPIRFQMNPFLLFF